ncbi:MAG TPA: deoxyribodipyrimidine photo-lyase [Candidatus Solibacter sp.]|jgi:deoxyribodipyrimidine photo-lyase|nr:deoxyribodipyrimidine photo-lyase [Candidatus Solibacter sp.]
MPDSVIHWFRRDLRLDDDTAFDAALRSGDPVLPVFVLDDAIIGSPAHPRAIEPWRLAFLAAALLDLAEGLEARGSRLVVRRGDAARELNHVAEEAGSWGVYFNRDHTPYARRRDARATRGLQMTGVVSQTFDDQLLVSPQLMLDAEGRPPANFDEFSAAWLARLNVDPEPQPALEGSLMAANDAPDSVGDWRGELAEPDDQPAPPGSTPATARAALKELTSGLGGRPEPGAAATVLTALRFGTISVREVARAVLSRAASEESARAGAEAFMLDLCHREHAIHLVHAYPALLGAPGAEGDYIRHWVRPNPLP